MEEALVHRSVVQLAKRSAVGIGKYGFRPKLFRCRREFVRYGLNRLVPSYALERSRAARRRTFRHAGTPLHRIEQSIRRIDTVKIFCHFGAEKTARHRMPRIALDLYRLSIVYGDEHAAGVRTIMRTGSVDDSLGRRLHGRLDDYTAKRMRNCFWPIALFKLKFATHFLQVMHGSGCWDPSGCL